MAVEIEEVGTVSTAPPPPMTIPVTVGEEKIGAVTVIPDAAVFELLGGYDSFVEELICACNRIAERNSAMGDIRRGHAQIPDLGS